MIPDIIIYNNTAAVGLIFLTDLWDSPVVTFVIEERKNEILSHAIVRKFDKELTIYLKNKYKPGSQIEACDFSPIAFIYADIMNKGLLNLNNRDNDFYELASNSQNFFILKILDYLKDNLTGKNKEYYFKCAELLGDAFDGIGYRIQAFCYQEGIFVKKSLKTTYKLMKKAAECGDKQSIEWIKKEDEARKRRK